MMLTCDPEGGSIVFCSFVVRPHTFIDLFLRVCAGVKGHLKALV